MFPLMRVAPLALLLIAAACAPVSKLPKIDSKLAEAEALKQRELVIREKVKNEARLINVVFPILRDSADLCGEKVGRGAGMKLANIRMFPPEYHKAAENVLGMSDRPQVMVIADGSPAAEAGLKPGDVITELDDWAAPVGRDSVQKVVAHIQEESRERDSMTLAYLRGGHPGTARLNFVERCEFGYGVTNAEVVNAFADGKRIMVAAGMMRFATSDDELAVVVGHEIAHNLMAHLDKQRGNAAIGFVFDLLFAGLGVNTQGAFSNMAAAAYSSEFEAEADYVGLYLTARAGFPIAEAPDFWRRMGVAHPGSIKSSHMASHPATPERFLALDLTVKEINEKRAAGTPLIPEKGYRPPFETDDAQPETPPGS